MKNILMNVEMTKAILDGRKVQTRRVIKKEIITKIWNEGNLILSTNGKVMSSGVITQEHSKYQIGETIWVREPSKVLNYSALQASMQCEYLADSKIKSFMIPPRLRQKSGGNFPNWILNTNKGKAVSIPNSCIKEMARIFLKITDVRVEKFYERTLEDIIAEGCPKEILEMDDNPYQDEWFENQYPKINPQDYVFVYEFERVENGK